MGIVYSGMVGCVSLGTDLMSRNVRQEMGWPDSVYLINLSTCETHSHVEGGPIYVDKVSPLRLIPVLARTAARRRRYGVTWRYTD